MAALEASDFSRAYANILTAAKTGNATALSEIGSILDAGLGTEIGAHAAARWFCAAAGQGQLSTTLYYHLLRGGHARRQTKKLRTSELSFGCRNIYTAFGHGRKRLIDRFAKLQKLLADRFVVRRHIAGAIKILKGTGMLTIRL